MDSFSLLPVTLASILSSFSGTNGMVEEAVITTHTMPEIAGTWELELEEPSSLSEQLSKLAQLNELAESDSSNSNNASNNSASNNSAKDIDPELEALILGIIESSAIEAQLLSESESYGEDTAHITSIEIMETDSDTDHDNSYINDFEVNDFKAYRKGKDAQSQDLENNIIPLKQSPITQNGTINNVHNNEASRLKADNTCYERYNFGADNVVLTTSGAEWTYGQYIYQHTGDGLPIIAINTLYDNNEVDCSGVQVDQTNTSMMAYVDYQPQQNEMHWCIDNEGKTCFMSFKKLLP